MSSMQHIATHCNRMQHTATNCNTLHHCDMWGGMVVMSSIVTFFRHVFDFFPSSSFFNSLQQTETHATHCSTLQHTVVTLSTGSALQHNATHCNTLQQNATHCITLQHTTVRCNTLQHTVTTPSCDYEHTSTHCNTLQHTATRCNPLQHTTARCTALQLTATRCDTL